MAPHNKLANHAGNAQKKDTANVNKYKGRTAVVSRHKGETPHVAQTHGRTRRGKYDAYFAAEAASFRSCHFLQVFTGEVGEVGVANRSDYAELV